MDHCARRPDRRAYPVNDLIAIGQVVLIDIVLAGDNAVVIGALAAGLPEWQRPRVITAGIAMAVVCRIALSSWVALLLLFPGIKVIGGLLLLWVSWKMWKDLRDGSFDGQPGTKLKTGFWAASSAILLADLSMSLDNVLGVAGAASGHLLALAIGLLLSMGIMAVGASWIAKLIDRHKWIAYIGLGLILLVAGRMIVSPIW